MFAVIYRGYLKAGKEAEYQKLWHLVAEYFIKHRGALGSCLHKAEDGMWLAYSRWPNKESRDEAWPQDESVNEHFPDEIRDAILGIKDCVDEQRKLPDICMCVIDDFFGK